MTRELGETPTTNEKLLGAAGHIGYLAGLPLIFPLVLYIWQRDQSRFVAEQAKQAVLLHLFAIFTIVSAVLLFFYGFGLNLMHQGPLSLATVGIEGASLILIVSLLGFLSVVFTCVAVLNVAQGRHYRYPVIGNLLG